MTEDQAALDVGGPTLDASPSRAAAQLRRDLEAALLDTCSGVVRVGPRGENLPERERAELAGRHEGNKGWPDFVALDGSSGFVWVRAVASTEVNALRRPRLWTVEGPAWERLADLDRTFPYARVVLAFDDGLAIALRDMRRGYHWERSDHGRTAHVAVMDRDRRPLAEVLA